MATEKQIEANRRNAALSTGPKTDEGKAKSRLNATKHGIFASAILAKSVERQEDWDELIAGLIESLQPVDYFEMTLVEMIAMCMWRIRRVVQQETQTIDGENSRERVMVKASLMTNGMPVFHLPESYLLERLDRYEVGLRRHLIQLLRELERHQALRKESELGTSGTIDLRLADGPIA